MLYVAAVAARYRKEVAMREADDFDAFYAMTSDPMPAAIKRNG